MLFSEAFDNVNESKKPIARALTQSDRAGCIVCTGYVWTLFVAWSLKKNSHNKKHFNNI
jgi:hypothetical protein